MTPASSSAPAHHPRLAAGIACGVGAGALWGLVFLAPQLLHDFSPLQPSASRYLAYGAVALAVLAPRWRRARRHSARPNGGRWCG
jgi:drug/metabolite transporter (DMT)-like permease